MERCAHRSKPFDITPDIRAWDVEAFVGVRAHEAANLILPGWNLVEVELDVLFGIVCDEVSEEVRVDAFASYELEAPLLPWLLCFPLGVQSAVFCALYSYLLPASSRVFV